MNETMNNLIAQYGVVPVVVLEDEKDALPLAEALIKGGLPVAEVTFRTAAAEGSIKAMCEAYPEMLVGAGTVTPSEVTKAVKRGLNICKFFPAEQYGGVSTIKALSAPFTTVKFMPTGGVSAKNLKDYLSCSKIVACGGSWMVKGDLIKAHEFDKIRELTAEAVELVKEIRG